jgi:hypothetical protein
MSALTLDTILTSWPMACREGKNWLVDYWPAERSEWTIAEALEAGCEISHAVWLAARVSPAYLRAVVVWAADCAERVLPVFEGRYPNDKRPRAAIEATRRCIDDPSADNRQSTAAAYAAARSAANFAADAANRAYAADAAARAYAADAAYAAARSAANFAADAAARAYAADAAARAADAAADAYAAAAAERDDFAADAADNAAVDAYAARAYAAAPRAAADAAADLQTEHQWQRVRLIELLRQADQEPQP